MSHDDDLVRVIRNKLPGLQLPGTAEEIARAVTEYFFDDDDAEVDHESVGINLEDLPAVLPDGSVIDAGIVIHRHRNADGSSGFCTHAAGLSDEGDLIGLLELAKLRAAMGDRD